MIVLHIPGAVGCAQEDFPFHASLSTCCSGFTQYVGSAKSNQEQHLCCYWASQTELCWFVSPSAWLAGELWFSRHSVLQTHQCQHDAIPISFPFCRNACFLNHCRSSVGMEKIELHGNVLFHLLRPCPWGSLASPVQHLQPPPFLLPLYSHLVSSPGSWIMEWFGMEGP